MLLLLVFIGLLKSFSFEPISAVIWKNDKLDTFNLTKWNTKRPQTVSRLECFFLCLANPDCYGVQFDTLLALCQQLSFKCKAMSFVQIANDASTAELAISSTINVYHLLRVGHYCPAETGYTFLKELCLCVKYYSDLVKQSEAESRCYDDGGELVRIDNALKQEGVWEYVHSLGAVGGVTIQGKKKSGKWFYDDNTVFDFFNWNIDGNQPNNGPGEDYLMMYVTLHGKWHDVYPSDHPFICEIEL